MMSMTGTFRRWLSGLLLSMGAVLVVHAHSLHQSTTEIEFNPATKKLEVSLTVFINDLETALIRQAQRDVSFEKTAGEELDAQIKAWLGSVFIITTADATKQPVEWIGREPDPDSAKSSDPAVTLFFTVPVPQGLEGCSLDMSAFTDRFKDQLNLVHLKQDTAHRELKFTADARLQKLAEAR